MTNRSLKKVLILASILMMPGLMYYLLQEKGKNRYRPLSFYGPKTLSGTYHTKRGKKIPDTTYHRVAAVSLIDQHGRSSKVPDSSGFISIINFTYSNCQSCATLNESMAEVVDTYKHNKRLRYITITIDPATDNASKLLSFANRYRADTLKTWNFYTGNEQTIYNFARNQLFVDVLRDSRNPNHIISRQLLILLDAKNRIRGYYDALSKEQVEKLLDEVKVLIAEELRQVTLP